MRAFISQNNFLNILKIEEEKKEMSIEKNVKIEICEIIQTILNIRNNFIISNFIAWYQKIQLNSIDFNEKQMKKEINEDLTSVLPKLLKSGIDIIDNKLELKVELNAYNIVGYFGDKLNGFLGNLTNQNKQYKSKNFKIYTTEKEIPDLDTLLTNGKNEGLPITKAVFPSLLIAFYLAKDFELENILLEVILKCYNRKNELAKCLKSIDPIIGKEDIVIYNDLNNILSEFRNNVKRSEVKLFLIFIKDLRFG